jgi:hypothetical protein
MVKPSEHTYTRNGTFDGIPTKLFFGIVCLVGLVANCLLVSNIYNVTTATLPVTMTAKTTSRHGVDMDEHELQQPLKSEAQEDDEKMKEVTLTTYPRFDRSLQPLSSYSGIAG